MNRQSARAMAASATWSSLQVLADEVENQGLARAPLTEETDPNSELRWSIGDDIRDGACQRAALQDVNLRRLVIASGPCRCLVHLRRHGFDVRPSADVLSRILAGRDQYGRSDEDRGSADNVECSPTAAGGPGCGGPTSAVMSRRRAAGGTRRGRGPRRCVGSTPGSVSTFGVGDSPDAWSRSDGSDKRPVAAAADRSTSSAASFCGRI